jgi:serine O-acetyltransferase
MKITEKLGVILCNPGLHAVLLYRLSRWFYLHRMHPISILTAYFNSIFTGAQISHRAIIGKGLAIYHPQGTVIGAGAVIGNHCTLSHGNTIGQLYGDNDRPTIGDYFHASAGARILGKIKIGNNVRVGPNAVVVDSLPDDVTVALSMPRTILRGRSDLPAANSQTPSPSRQAILQRLLLILPSAAPVVAELNSIDEETGLQGEGIGLDSIDILRLIGEIEEEFQLTVDERQLKVSYFQTIGSIVTFIEERLSS